MTQRPFFSIVVPTFNASETLGVLLQSILVQDFKGYEVIVVDGCSVDDTLNVLHNYQFDNIRLVVEPDKGIYDAMNKGIDVATGEWLIFMGADDSLSDNAVLSSCFVNIQDSCAGVDLVFGRYSIGGSSRRNSFDWRLLFTNSVNHQSVFYSSRIFAQRRYSLRYRYASDYWLNLCLYLSNYTAAEVDVLISAYSTCGRSNSNSSISRSELCAVRRELLPYSFPYIEIIRFVRKFLLRLIGKI